MPVEIEQRFDQVVTGTWLQRLAFMLLHEAAVVGNYTFESVYSAALNISPDSPMSKTAAAEVPTTKVLLRPKAMKSSAPPSGSKKLGIK